MGAKGVKVDLLFPPYPVVAYYDWIDRRLYNDSFGRGPVYPQLIDLKRCALQAAAPFGDRVTITAMDNDLVVTNDLGAFADAVHLLKPEAYQRMLDHVASRDARLTQSNFQAYQDQLAANIVALKDHPPVGLFTAP